MSPQKQSLRGGNGTGNGFVPASAWRYILPSAILALMIAVTLLASQLHGCSGTRSATKEAKAPPIYTPAPDTEAVIRQALSDMAGLPYEEFLAAPLADGVKQADYALVQAMLKLGLPASAITLAHAEFRHQGDQAYQYQVLRIGMDKDSAAFAAALKEALAAWAHDAALFPLRDNAWGVSVAGIPTHELVLVPYDPASVWPAGPTTPAGPAPWRPVPRSPGSEALLVIVIDDLGESMRAARTLADLPYPVTCAVWPDSSHAREVAELAHGSGLEVIVHQPMEPMDYPAVSPGPNAILLTTSAFDAANIVRRSLSRVPHAVGLNNHMGSRLTGNAAALRPVIDVLANRSLLALDSLTHPTSVFYQEAKAAGIPALRRDVFLDVDPAKTAVLAQLAKAERVALLTGRAIAIGHPLPGTLEALVEWGRIRNTEIRIVTLRDLLR